MLPRHQKRLLPARPPVVAAVGHAPARVDTCLVLPALDKTIPREFEYDEAAFITADLAAQFVRSGILQPRHWAQVRGRDSLPDTCAAALAEFASSARPRPRAKLLSVTAWGGNDDVDVSTDCYAKHIGRTEKDLFKAPPPKAAQNPDSDFVFSQIRGLIVAQDYDSNGSHMELVGPVLEALEAWPRLGQTVLHVLERGFQNCTRVLGPGTGLGWASSHYWQGEDDETFYVMDELSQIKDDIIADCKKAGKPIPTDEQIIDEHCATFRRKHYDAAIPRKWQFGGRKPLKPKDWPLSLPPPVANVASLPDGGKTLAEIFGLTRGQKVPAPRRRRAKPVTIVSAPDHMLVSLMRERWPDIRAAMERIQSFSAKSCDNDNQFSYSAGWEACPFILRFSENDPLPQIADDVMNSVYEAGEANLQVNSLFLWHDDQSLKHALRRLHNFLRLTQACEDLLALLDYQSVHIPLRVRV